MRARMRVNSAAFQRLRHGLRPSSFRMGIAQVLYLGPWTRYTPPR